MRYWLQHTILPEAVSVVVDVTLLSQASIFFFFFFDFPLNHLTNSIDFAIDLLLTILVRFSIRASAGQSPSVDWENEMFFFCGWPWPLTPSSRGGGGAKSGIFPQGSSNIKMKRFPNAFKSVKITPSSTRPFFTGKICINTCRILTCFPLLRGPSFFPRSPHDFYSAFNLYKDLAWQKKKQGQENKSITEENNQ